MKKFDVVWCGSQLVVILSDVMDIPHYPDHLGTLNCNKDFDPRDPEQWETFRGHLVWDLINDRYDVAAEYNLRDYDPVMDAYIAHDMVTGKLRALNGLLNLTSDERRVKIG